MCLYQTLKIQLSWLRFADWAYVSSSAVGVRLQTRDQFGFIIKTIQGMLFEFFCKTSKWAHLASFFPFRFFVSVFQRVSDPTIGS